MLTLLKILQFGLDNIISKENAAVVTSWVDDNKEKLKKLFPVLDMVMVDISHQTREEPLYCTCGFLMLREK